MCAVTELERSLGQQTLGLVLENTGRAFISIAEQRVYRLFILDYFLTRLLEISSTDAEAKAAMVKALVWSLKTPNLAVVDSLRPLLGIPFKLPMLEAIGVDTSREDRISWGALDAVFRLKQEHEVSVLSGLNELFLQPADAITGQMCSN